MYADSLAALADKNSDMYLQLMEIERYNSNDRPARCATTT